MRLNNDWICPFETVTLQDIPRVGGKNASLGEMIAQLSAKGVQVPTGFAITAQAYRLFIEHNHLKEKIQHALAVLDTKNLDQLAHTGAQIREWISHGDMPAELENAIVEAYRQLCAHYDSEKLAVAIRSSATAEDLPGASFAGQQETYLNIRGEKNLLHTCKRVFASLFTNRAISYRVDKGFEHDQVALSIGVQKMVRSDLACSGVIFTLDTESGFRDAVLITSAYGLGENVVQGAVNPDEFLVHKPTLQQGFSPIIKAHLGEKALRMVYAADSSLGHSTKNKPTHREEREQFSLSEAEVIALAKQAVIIEQHYSALHGKPMAMDIEWAKDGEDGQLYILQARPETVHSEYKNTLTLARDALDAPPQTSPLTRGKSVGHRIASGIARVIEDPSQIDQVQPGDILVTDMTDPDWEPIMQIAAAIVTNRGGRTCHAAIIARELGIPALVGCGDATHTILDDTPVTVECAQGDVGFVWAGRLPFTTTRTQLESLPTTRTHLMLNVANPDTAFEVAKLPAYGVGLARLEFIINHAIKVHPLALKHLETLPDRLAREIRQVIKGYSSPKSFYVHQLAQGIGRIAAAFYPRPVIVRLADFKSNEYASLIGGALYEPQEENPMLGLRGAARYPHPDFVECFAWDVEAIRRVREDMGLTNVQLMVPFVRTPQEGRQVLDWLASEGIEQSDDLKIYLMCEIPANALLAEEFLKDFDGFSIGSNDLTQLTLGVDRDSGLLSGYDERNPAVMALMAMAITACKRQGKYIGICGQAPSDFPEITRWLVEQGIESISLNSDSFLAMLPIVAQAEAERTH
jgi:pyruvate,water dikinase